MEKRLAFFGIENNLGRSPRTWFKPNVGIETTPHTTYERNDDFSGKDLKPIWQWNHYPVEKKWALKTERYVCTLCRPRVLCTPRIH